MENGQTAALGGPNLQPLAFASVATEDGPLGPIPGPRPGIPDYELLRRIGRGAYGEVWLARNLAGSFVAVKVVAHTAFDHDRPFEREFQGIKRFEPISRSHPSQIAILHVGRNTNAGCFYYVMELADDLCRDPDRREIRDSLNPIGGFAGDSVARHIGSYSPHTLRSDLQQQKRLPISDCVKIGLALSTALAHLHRNGLVHRDIKPSNVLFVNGVPKLGDIGLVTEVGDTQSIVGTEGYLPPEGPGTPPADIYSLGKVLYEMSTGLDRRRFAELPADLRSWRDFDAAVEFNQIVLKACAGDAARRYPSAEALLADLEQLQRGKSVRRNHVLQSWRSVAKKVGWGTAILSVVLTALLLIPNRPGTAPSVPTVARVDGPPSKNAEANRLYQKAMFIIRGDNRYQMREAFTNLTRAIQLDPKFAGPYAGLIEVGMAIAPGVPDISAAQVRECADKLRELVPSSAASYWAEGWAQYLFNWNYHAAEQAARVAVKTDPNDDRGHLLYGFLLILWGRIEEARAELNEAEALAPSRAFILHMQGNADYFLRDYPTAIKQYRKALEQEPNDPQAHYFIGRACQATNDFTTAIAEFEKDSLAWGDDPLRAHQRADALRNAFNAGGQIGYWQKRWDLIQGEPSAYYARAVIQIHLGNTSEALRLLNQSYDIREQREARLDQLLFDEYWDGLRDDPRFKELLKKLGFNKVMRPQW